MARKIHEELRRAVLDARETLKASDARPFLLTPSWSRLRFLVVNGGPGCAGIRICFGARFQGGEQ